MTEEVPALNDAGYRISSPADQDYIGVKKCGCTVAWVAGDLEKKRLAEVVGEWIRRGYSLERCTTEQARGRIKRCLCKPAPRGRIPS